MAPAPHRLRRLLNALSRAAMLMAGCVVVACSGGRDAATEPQGSLVLTISGVASGGNVRVTGPNNFGRSVNFTTTFTGLRAGSYEVRAEDVAPWEVFAPEIRVQTINVTGPGATAAVSYRQVSGTLFISTTGAPAGSQSKLLLRGPGNFSREVEAPVSVNGLLPGEYWIIPQPAYSGSCAFTAAGDSMSRTISAGQTTSADVIYQPESHAGYNMCIESAYVVQAVQRRRGDIPLVQGRDAMLRVFVRGNLPSAAMPTVRARFFQNGAVIHTLDIPATGPVPLTPDESSKLSTWNVTVPGSLVAPGIGVLLEVDPQQQIVTEVQRGDNTYPRTGVPLALEPRAVPPTRVRLVPVMQTTAGNVNNDNAANFMWATRGIAPLGELVTEVGDVFVTQAPAVNASNSNGAWQQILQELEVKRVTETGTGPPRHYVGVLNTGYTSGIAGMAYVPGWTSLIWDHLQQSSASWVLAHELGHNWGRFHVAGCSNPSGIDHAYPHGGGSIGVYGADPRTGTLYTPAHADIMSYCNTQWISDYNYLAVMTFRGFGPVAANAPPAGRVQDVMIVWGSVRNGQLQLQPSFVTRAVPSLPERAGRYRLEGLGEDGGALFSFTFDPAPIAHLETSERHFVFAVPVSIATRQRLTTLRVTGGGGTSTRALRTAAAAPSRDGIVVEQRGGAVQLRWDAAAAEALLVRSARTGEVVAIARGGRAQVAAHGVELDIVPADAPAAPARRLSPSVRR